MVQADEQTGPQGISRREAIRRAALLAGVAFSPAWLTFVERRATAAQAPAQTQTSVQTEARYLSPVQFAVASAMADRILPRTDTPGAADVGVPAFIDRLYGEFMTDVERQMLISGLDAVSRASAADGVPFPAWPADRQDNLLRVIAQQEEGQPQGPFRLIRSATILGYFTSEQVGRNVLHYDPVPGRYEACVPLSEVGHRNWTT